MNMEPRADGIQPPTPWVESRTARLLRRASTPFLGALLLFNLACPGPFGGPYGDHFPDPPPTYNHSQSAEMVTWFQGEGGTTGVWAVTVGVFAYGLTGTAKGLHIQYLDSPSIFHDVPGPAGPEPVQRDVETYAGYAYVCSARRGSGEGIQVVDLRNLPSPPTLVHIFLPQDGQPEASNLSIETTRGLLFLQRSLGVEIWDLKPDPARPVFLGRLAEDAPVSDLVAQGTRLFLAEGTARRFSIWDVADPAHPTLLSRWEARGFANSIWPREDGQLIGTLEENPAAPFRLWALNALGTPSETGHWSLDGRTLASSLKIRGGQAFLAHREAGLVVLSITNPGAPALTSRFDGPTNAADPALRQVYDVALRFDPPYPGGPVLVSDRVQGLVTVSTY